MAKKLIGYRLNGVVSREIADRVIKYKMPQWYDDLYFIKGHLGGSFVKDAERLGILDKWFTPVYEEEKNYTETQMILYGDYVYAVLNKLDNPMKPDEWVSKGQPGR